MSIFDDVVSPTSLTEIRTLLLGYATAAKLRVTSWGVGDVAQQFFETQVAALYAYAQTVPALVRGYVSLDTATDPGDEDPYDATNVTRTQAPGFLSSFGENTFGTARVTATYASGVVTFANAGPGSRTVAPESLVFTWSGGSPPSPAPTYSNVADSSVYTNPDGTVTVAAGTSVDLPVSCTTIGSNGSAPSGTLTLTTSLVGCSATNASPIVGSDREDADSYRTACRQAVARLSFGASSDAFLYFATHDLNGDPLKNASGDTVAISKAQTTHSSSTGVVSVYYATDSGSPTSVDVDAAVANTELNASVVMDAITFSGMAASAVTVHVQGTAKIRGKTGVDALAKAGIVEELGAYFKEIPCGGFDQNSAGAGSLYTADIAHAAASGYQGLYDVRVTLPSSASMSIDVGTVPVLQCSTSDWTITVVS